MANIVYENKVLESKLNDLLNTRLDAKALMTIDYSLAEQAGMTKTINKYTYTGAVETLGIGEKNTVLGSLTHVGTDYTVVLAQQTFPYFDEEVMKDPNVIDMGMNGAATVMINDMNTKYFTELAKATVTQEYTGAITYDTIVDAISLMNLEDESGLFLVIGNDLKADIRKDADFKAKELGKVIADGQIGTICGVPVIVSKLVPATEAFLATKEAVTLHTKKESEVAQQRDEETRKNLIIMRKVNLVALTDATKVVKIVKAA